MNINTESLVSIEEEPASTSEALVSARKLFKKHLPAFKELAK